MPGLRCGASLCQFTSAEGTMDQMFWHLSLHAQTAHPVRRIIDCIEIRPQYLGTQSDWFRLCSQVKTWERSQLCSSEHPIILCSQELRLERSQVWSWEHSELKTWEH